MFLGTFQHAIDEKGRLTLPSKWRDYVEAKVVITRGLDDCLFILPETRFVEIAKIVDAQGFESTDAREWGRYLFANAEMVEVDKQGRILVPQPLRTEFGLNGEVTLVGVFSRIELWHPEKYKAMNARVTADPVALAERVRALLYAK
ncbi:MAG: division/cell wall cluster transcriptional repressor MraZ [Anaerolineae bacterium]|nr:division/cell wall cluster transcriptional repressor MraZ [Anaerolineae bacterium]